VAGSDPPLDALERLRTRTEALTQAILDGDGVTAPEARREAFDGAPADPLIGRYVDLVRRMPTGSPTATWPLYAMPA
jgi:hypothetical protein